MGANSILFLVATTKVGKTMFRNILVLSLEERQDVITLIFKIVPLACSSFRSLFFSLRGVGVEILWCSIRKNVVMLARGRPIRILSALVLESAREPILEAVCKP